MSKQVHRNFRWIKIYTRPKAGGDPLKFLERLVYSFLSARCKRAFSLRRIAKYTGLNKNTVKAILDKLQEHGLVGLSPSLRWFAREPDENTERWFETIKTDGEWQKRFAYWRYYVPSESCPLTYKQLAVYCLLCSYGTFRGVRGLVKVLGFALNTVKTTIKKLVSHNLVGQAGDIITTKPLPPECKCWFQEVNVADKVADMVVKSGSQLERTMRTYGCTDGEIMAARRLIGQLLASKPFVDSSYLDGLLERAKKSHNPERYPGKSPGPLFIHMLGEAMKK